VTTSRSSVVIFFLTKRLIAAAEFLQSPVDIVARRRQRHHPGGIPRRQRFHGRTRQFGKPVLFDQSLGEALESELDERRFRRRREGVASIERQQRLARERVAADTGLASKQHVYCRLAAAEPLVQLLSEAAGKVRHAGRLRGHCAAPPHGNPALCGRREATPADDKQVGAAARLSAAASTSPGFNAPTKPCSDAKTRSRSVPGARRACPGVRRIRPALSASAAPTVWA
jgi:hypothetical protein